MLCKSAVFWIVSLPLTLGIVTWDEFLKTLLRLAVKCASNFLPFCKGSSTDMFHAGTVVVLDSVHNCTFSRLGRGVSGLGLINTSGFG